MRKLLTNCPNCNGVLNIDGRCPYCGTHVRYANELDIQANDMLTAKDVEIKINVTRGGETVVFPFVGRLTDMTISHGSRYSLPEVELSFYGTLMDIQ